MQVAKTKGQSSLLCRPGASVVKDVPRAHRVAQVEIPAAPSAPALALFKRDWVVVEHLDLQYRNPPQLPPKESLPPLHYELRARARVGVHL